MVKKMWIAGAIRKKGALRKQLGIKPDKKIPTEVLKKIATAKITSKVSINGTVRVTPTLKKRVVLAQTLKKLSKKKSKK